MDRIEQLLKLMAQVASLTSTVADLVAEGREALSSNDEVKLKAGLADLRAKNDAAYDRVQEKLKAAAS